jgi:hypothetical protein
MRQRITVKLALFTSQLFLGGHDVVSGGTEPTAKALQVVLSTWKEQKNSITPRPLRDFETTTWTLLLTYL